MAKAPTLAPAPAQPEVKVNESGSQVVVEVAPAKKAKPVHPADEEINQIERENHERTEKLAKNIPLTGKTEEEEAEQRARAEARLERLKQRAPLDNEDAHNARPSNWSVKDIGGGKIFAKNRITGVEYKGDRAGFMKN